MKPKRKILSLLFVICLVAGLLPTTTFALDGDKTIMLGTSRISGYDSTKGYDYIYYGNWTASDTHTTSGPIKWRVLDDQTNTGETGLFLLSDGLLGTGNDGGVYFQQTAHIDYNSYEFHKGSEPSDGDHTNCQIANAWQGSDAQAWCNTFYSGNLTMQEQGAVLATTESDEALAASENILNGDKVFFLSTEEAKNSAYGFANDNARIAYYGNRADVWWLRTPDAEYPLMAGAVNYDGNVDKYSFFVSNGYPARPAFNLDLNSVLFTSAAVGGKSANGMESGLTAVDAYDGGEWKLTLLDDSRDFAVTEKTASGKPGDTITLNYTGATAYHAESAPNEYISAMIVDGSGAQYYGRITQPTSAGGQVKITIPASLADGTYTLNVFNEQYNGDYKTDYASAFEAVTLTVSSDTTAPTLSGGSATRDSETSATVKFTSDEAGTYYYAVVESNEAAPTIDTTGTGTACDTTEQTISLNNLSGAGAKDIYIVAKDAAGNVSQPLKITIPAYIAPVYAIFADTQLLDFGTVTEGYTQAPAAKTVTITNTGNQDVTVDLPTSTNYTVTAGTGFTNGKAALSSGGKAQNLPSNQKPGLAWETVPKR